MIGRLSGKLISKQAPQLMLDVNGVGYELEAPMSTFYELPGIGDALTLFTHLQVREDAHTLYAFIAEAERGMFRALIKVSGVGAKMALAILSTMSAVEFREHILHSQVAALTRIPGVGKKTAERLIIEMRDRVEKDWGPSTVSDGALAGVPRAADPVVEAEQALVALGYKPAEASRMIHAVASQELSSEQMIRLALQAAAK